MRTHEIITGWLHLIAGLFIFGCVAMIWYAAAQLASWFSATFIPGLLAMVGIPIAVILLAASGLEIVAAFSLIMGNAKQYAWARPVLIGVSALQLLLFSIGTAIAAYSLWALLTQNLVSTEPGAPVVPHKQ